MDAVTKKIDKMVKEHEAAIKRLRSFRHQYLESPDLREVIASLVAEDIRPSAVAVEKNSDNGKPSMVRVHMLDDAPGMTGAILEIVEQSPGIQAPDLIDRVMERINTKSKKPRRAIASTYDYLIKRNRLIKNNGGFYLGT